MGGLSPGTLEDFEETENIELPMCTKPILQEDIEDWSSIDLR